MPDYDFLNLSPPEFEDLTRDLLQKHFNITLESFTSGRDNGIDLRYSSSANNDLIIQCKRYKDYNSLFSNLKKEKTKLQSLSLKKYIIATTVGLTPNQKDKILKLFNPYIRNKSDILGRNDLNNLLSIFPEIEKQHFKLWLSSTSILEKILHSKILNQSNFEEEIIKDTINVYVDNESYNNANKIIKEKKYVIISGIPGIGKTTLARILVYHYLANGFEQFVFLSGSIDEGYKIYKEGVKQIFLFDDFLGTNFLDNKLSNNEEQRIVKFIEKVSRSKDKIIILTTREYILAQAKQKYDIFNNPSLDFAKCVLDLSQYTKIVKAKILYNHLFFSNVSSKHILDLLKNETYKTIIEHPNYNPRIIQTITNDDIWSTIRPSDFSKKFIEFIKNPTSVWKHVYENQISKLSQCILANLMTAGTPILLEDLKTITQNFAKNHSLKYGITYSELEFKKSIRELENTFIRIQKDTENQLGVEYQNPSVQDFLVHYFVDSPDFLRDILQSALYFNQLFVIFSLEKSRDSWYIKFIQSKKIVLGTELKNIVIEKLIKEFDNLKSTSLRGSIYFVWRKDTFSDYLKLDAIRQSLTLSAHPNIRDFIKTKFETIIEPIELQGDELNYYINLLNEFYLDLDLDRVKIIRYLSENLNQYEEIEEFERLESIFPLEYETFIKEDKEFSDKISELIIDEAKYTEEDFEEKLAELKAKANKFKISIEDAKSEIQEKIERKKLKEENAYDWDAENTKKPVVKKDEDNETIKSIFDSLRTERKTEG